MPYGRKGPCRRCGKTFEAKSNKGPMPQTCYECKEEVAAEKIQTMVEKYGHRPNALPDSTDPDDMVDIEAVDTYPPADDLSDWEPTPELRGKVETEPSWLDAPEIQDRLAEKNASNQSGGTIDLDQASDETADYADVDLYEPLPIEMVSREEMLALLDEPDEDGDDTNPPPPDDIVDKLRQLGATDEDIAEAQPVIDKTTGKVLWGPARQPAPPPVVDESAYQGRAGECVVQGCQMPDPRHANGRICDNHWRLIPLEVRGTLLGSPDDSAPFNQALMKALRPFRP